MKKTFKRLAALALGATMVMSLAACGNSDSKKDDNKTYTVGICQLVQHPALDEATKGFKDALTAEFGDKITFDEQNAAGDSATCSTIANSFVSKKVDLIMANATPALQACVSATGSIPILGTSVTEYGVALSIQDFNGTVGGNVSGTSDLAPLDKQAAMVKEFCPDAKNVGLLYCSAEANSKYQCDMVKKYLEEMGYNCKIYTFTDSNDISAVVTKCADDSDVIYIPTDNTVASNTGLIDSVCSQKKVPIIAGEEGIASGCGIATLSISYYDLGTATGKMAAKILKGEADIAKMAVEYAPNFTKKVVKDRCDKLGIKIPDGYEEIK
ncbi:MAG: ABC transporter substrate-binding protein [Lachnospiraceae bacterium]